MILPPKRFENDNDPRYDGIRFQPWFRFLGERREKIPDLSRAMHIWRKYSGVRRDAQKAAAEECNVDERELRDYIDFFLGKDKGADKVDKHILNEAYQFYCLKGGELTLKACLDRVAPYYGRSARRVLELYETDRNFYPDGYAYAKH